STDLCVIRRSFFMITHCPLRPTLFPYTTLFRSTVSHGPRAQTPELSRTRSRGQSARDHRSAVGHPLETVWKAQKEDFGRTAVRQDRKSTRLNSSHVKISYAVFCLKKKKKYG